MRPALALFAALLVTASWHANAATDAATDAASKVEVNFLPPDKYVDIGDSPRQEDDNLKQLGDYFRKIGDKGLAEGQTLTLDLKDIDLAGRPRLNHRASGDYRIMTGRADWPRIKLHWVLHTPGAADRMGDDAMADMNYLERVPRWRNNEPLAYEKRMIDDWFKRTFGAATTAAAAP